MIRWIPTRTDLSEDGRRAWDEILLARGEVADLFALLLWSPELALNVERLSRHLRFQSSMPHLAKYIVALTVGRHFDCAYIWDVNVRDSRAAGLREDVIESIASGREPEDLDDAERATYRVCADLLTSHRLGANRLEEVGGALGNTTVVEVAALIGYYAMIAMIMNAFAHRQAE